MIGAILNAQVHHHPRHEDDGPGIEVSVRKPLIVSNRPAVPTLAVIAMLAGAFMLAPPVHGKSPWVSEYDLEPSLRSAALVVAVRVESVSPVRVVYGGKSTQTIYQYTFTPTRVLKGVYSRPELLMTSTDLQPYTYGFDPGDIQRGQQRLLILGRSNVGYYGIRPGSVDESFPSVSGPSDPLLGASEALLAQQELHDRLEIVSRLARDLRGAKGRGAVVLLAALDRRSDIAAQHEPAFEAVARQLESDEAFVREAAANVLANLLDADYLTNQPVRESAVTALVASLEKPTTSVKARVAAVQALASATDAVRANEDAVRLVRLDAPYDTLAELSARLDVLGRLHEDQPAAPVETVSDLLAKLPLDAPQDLQQPATQALARIAAADGAEQLLDRLRRKKSLGLEGTPEIEAFGLILPKAVDPWAMQRTLLGASLSSAEQVAFVRACEDRPSPQLVSALSTMLDPRQQVLRRMATDLLMEIDTRDAARAVQPHLAEETDLDYKLTLAAFLGRHGFDDGYPYALEHMSDRRYLEAAVVAIAAIRKSGSADQLIDIYRNSNDAGWKQASVRALGLLGHEPIKDELIVLTDDLSHPLASPALQARADLGDTLVLGLLPTALSSRNETVVIAAARAAATLLPQQVNEQTQAAADIRRALAEFAGDPEAAVAVRRYALEGMVAAEDPQLDRILIAMARDSRIEQTELLDRVRELMRERKVALR